MGDQTEARLTLLEENWKVAEAKIARLEGKMERLEHEMEEIKKQVARGMMNTGKEKDVQEHELDTQLRIGVAPKSGKQPDENTTAKRIDEMAKQLEQLRSYMSSIAPLWAMQSPSIAQQPTLLLQMAPAYSLNPGPWRSLPSPQQYNVLPSVNIPAPAPVAKSVSVTQPSSSKKKQKRPLETVSTPLTDLFSFLVETGLLKPKPSSEALKSPYIEGFKDDARCAYHSGALGHTTEECPEFREKVQKLIDEGVLGPVKAPTSIPKNKKK